MLSLRASFPDQRGSGISEGSWFVLCLIGSFGVQFRFLYTQVLTDHWIPKPLRWIATGFEKRKHNRIGNNSIPYIVRIRKYWFLQLLFHLHRHGGVYDICWFRKTSLVFSCEYGGPFPFRPLPLFHSPAKGAMHAVSLTKVWCMVCAPLRTAISPVAGPPGGQGCFYELKVIVNWKLTLPWFQQWSRIFMTCVILCWHPSLALGYTKVISSLLI